MREIKYKAFDKIQNEWLDRDDLIFQGGCWYKNFRALEDGVTLPVDEGNVVIVQYTGLKDCKGVDIYDGDILKAESNGLWRVYFEYCEWRVECVKTGEHTYSFSSQGIYEFTDRQDDSKVTDEVVGNIYEHADLLK